MAETVIRDVDADLPSLLREVEAGREIVITRDGRPVARVVPEEGKSRRLTPEQERAFAETEAFLDSLEPQPLPPDLPSGWPRNRDDIYDDIIASRGRPPA